MTDERARVWVIAGVLGPLAFWGAALIGATQVDGYSHRTQFVSELAAKGSDARPIMTAGFLIYGVCLVLFAAGLRRLWPSLVALWVIVGVSAVGTLAAGLGSCDAGCPTDGDVSFSQQVHNVASVPTFLAWLAASAVAAWCFRRTTHGRVAAALVAVQVAALIGLGSMMDGPADQADGLVQRVDLAAAGVWTMATAVAARRGDRVSG